MLIFKQYFVRRAHSTDQTPNTWVFPSGTHWTAESTETMWANILIAEPTMMQPRVEPSICISRNRLFALMVNMPMDAWKAVSCQDNFKYVNNIKKLLSIKNTDIVVAISCNISSYNTSSWLSSSSTSWLHHQFTLAFRFPTQKHVPQIKTYAAIGAFNQYVWCLQFPILNQTQSDRQSNRLEITEISLPINLLNGVMSMVYEKSY